MRLGAGDRLIFAMGYLGSKSGPMKKVTQLDLAKALIISRSRLKHVLGELRKEDLIGKDGPDPIVGYSLTRSGKERYGSIFEDIHARELIPELHQVSVRCKIAYLMETVRNPLDLVFLVSCFLRWKRVDIIEKLDQIKAIDPSSNDSMKLKEMLQDAEEDKEELERIISDLTFLGSRSDRPDKPDDYTTNSIDEMLIIADLKRRRGEVKEARWYYSSVLEKRNTLQSSRWIICIVGLIQCVLALEGQEKALQMIERTYGIIKDLAHIAMIRKVEADIYSDRNDFENARRLYNSCLGIFRNRNMVLMELSTMNNFGVLLFRHNDLNLAERYWLRCRKIAQQKGFVWFKTCVEMNLSDSFALKGKTKRAKNMLYESKRYMEEVQDDQSISYIYFNLALVSIEERKPDLALEYFDKAEVFPLIYTSDRIERRRVIVKRFEEKGFDPSRILYKHPLDE